MAYLRHDLRRFLDQRITKDGKTASMTGMGTGGKWFINDDDYPRFLDLMYDWLFVKKGRCNAFVEQPRKGEPKPLLIDLDFRYSNQTSLVRAFTLPQIKEFCEILVHGLRIFFNIDCNEMLRFFVTLRPAPYSSGANRKDGVHILCPDISLSEEKQRVLRNWMLSEGAVAKSFAGTGYTNAETDIYDESMVRKQGWIFYGESKPNIPPYSLAAVFKYWPESGEWEEEKPSMYEPRQLMELLSVRYNLVPDDNAVLSEAQELYEEMKNYGSEGTAAAAPPQQIVQYEDVSGAVAAAKQILGAITPTEQTPEDQGMVRRLIMECLDSPWYDTYDKWIRVGWCLHNISPSEENFKLWMDFSAKSGKSSGNNIAQLRRDWFHGMRKDGDGPRLTERSLHKWARDAAPDTYKEIMDQYLSEYIRQELASTHYHVAKLMKKMYGTSYIASVMTRTTDWYEYDDNINRWKRLNQGMELKRLICSDVANEISKARIKLRQRSLEEEKANMKDYNTQRAEDLLKIETSLYNSGFAESVMKMAVLQFYEEDFHNKLNINPFLLGCGNGVLDLRVQGRDGRDHVVFRQGRPEDYVSFLLGQNLPEMMAINYVPYDPADPAQAELDDFFAKLFPRSEVRAYTLRLLASCLEGRNLEQCFYIATGGGGNGKSKLMELMKMTFGDYQTTLQTTVLTRKRPESGAANPDIMAIKGRRFIAMQEPDDKEPINTSRMKQFSGEDMVEARALYGDQERFVIMGKMMMMCNKLPPVTTMDRGTWRRIRVIEFISKFVPPDHPELKAGRPNVFPIDYSLEKKLRSWREPFLSRLVHIYETEYIPNGLNPVPADVTKASDRYKESFDYCARFMADRIRMPKSHEEQMEMRSNPTMTKDIKNAFGSWKKENKITEIDFAEVLKRFTEEFGEPVKGKEWPTIKIFEDDEAAAKWDMDQAAAAAAPLEEALDA